MVLAWMDGLELCWKEYYHTISIVPKNQGVGIPKWKPQRHNGTVCPTLGALPIYLLLRHSLPLTITGTERTMLSRSSSSSSFFVSSSADEEHDDDNTFQGIKTLPNSKTARYEEMQMLFRRLELRPSQEELTKSSSLFSLHEELRVDFEIPDSPDNIAYDDNGNIHSATVPKLIERLTTAVGNPNILDYSL
jgi:hypothetical protein